MHAGVVVSLERAVGLAVAKLAAAAGTSRASLSASGAVRKRDVREMRRKAKSTVGHHLRVLGDPVEHANQLQGYLAGPLAEVQRLEFV
jgi:3-oxoacyl-ACP reductase-like protein